jgi:hypothetical protein
MRIKTLARMTQHFLKLSIIFGLLQAKIIDRRTEVNISSRVPRDMRWLSFDRFISNIFTPSSGYPASSTLLALTG